MPQDSGRQAFPYGPKEDGVQAFAEHCVSEATVQLYPQSGKPSMGDVQTNWLVYSSPDTHHRAATVLDLLSETNTSLTPFLCQKVGKCLSLYRHRLFPAT